MERRKTELSFIDALHNILKYRIIVVIFVIFAGLISVAFCVYNYYSTKGDVVYKINASMAVIVDSIDPERPPSIQDSQRIASSAAKIARSESLLLQVIEKTNTGTTTSTLGRAIQVDPFENTQLLDIYLIWPIADDGKRILEALLEELPDKIKDTLKLGDVTVYDPPDKAIPIVSYPGIRTYLLWCVIAIIAGFGVGCVMAVILGELRPKYRSARDIKNILLLDTLGEIPHCNEPDSENASEVFAFKERIRLAAAVLKFTLDKRNMKSLYVTSAAQGEGKSTLVANLALAMAQGDKKVLVIDFDTRRPRIGKLFNIPDEDQRSIENALEKKIKLIDSIIPINSNLDIIKSDSSTKRLDFSSLTKEINELRAAYDYIICDTAPVGIVGDSIMLNSFCDCALFIIKHEYALMDYVTAAVETLEKSGAEVIGCILNDVSSGIGGNSYYNKQNTYNYYKAYAEQDAEALKTN